MKKSYPLITLFLILLFSCAAGPGVLEPEYPASPTRTGPVNRGVPGKSAKSSPPERSVESFPQEYPAEPAQASSVNRGVPERSAEGSPPEKSAESSSQRNSTRTERAAVQPAAVPKTTSIPERPELPSAPQEIMGKGITNAQSMADFLLDTNPELDKNFALEFASFYIMEAQAEGINHDVAFSQMCLETGFLHYGGLVTPDMNNFCGLGAIGPEQRGEVFPNPQIGVRAHIQHLKAYASEEPLKQELVDPRFRWVRRGRAPKIAGLSGTWANDKQYAPKIEAILERLYEFSSIR